MGNSSFFHPEQHARSPRGCPAPVNPAAPCGKAGGEQGQSSTPAHTAAGTAPKQSWDGPGPAQSPAATRDPPALSWKHQAATGDAQTQTSVSPLRNYSSFHALPFTPLCAAASVTEYKVSARSAVPARPRRPRRHKAPARERAKLWLYQGWVRGRAEERGASLQLPFPLISFSYGKCPE